MTPRKAFCCLSFSVVFLSDPFTAGWNKRGRGSAMGNRRCQLPFHLLKQSYLNNSSTVAVGILQFLGWWVEWAGKQSRRTNSWSFHRRRRSYGEKGAIKDSLSLSETIGILGILLNISLDLSSSLGHQYVYSKSAEWEWQEFTQGNVLILTCFHEFEVKNKIIVNACSLEK